MMIKLKCGDRVTFEVNSTNEVIDDVEVFEHNEDFIIIWNDRATLEEYPNKDIRILNAEVL